MFVLKNDAAAGMRVVIVKHPYTRRSGSKAHISRKIGRTRVLQFNRHQNILRKTISKTVMNCQSQLVMKQDN